MVTTYIPVKINKRVDNQGALGIEDIIVFCGSARLTGGALGLQIRCGALKPSRVGSIPMHFRHFFLAAAPRHVFLPAPHI